MLSGNPFILLIGILSFLVFFFLLGTRASKKQRERSNKINWSWLFSINKVNEKQPKIIEGKSEEIEDSKNE
jgi:hypothetical protein|tara:strand:+ start:230 stop:442 length:213 start_codon:yes stop_codon:yes gene_type:complete